MTDRAIDKVKEILDERGKSYEVNGGPAHGASQLGRMWAALLSEHYGIVLTDIPPHIVLLMMSQLKLSRAARPTGYKQDNYIDGIAYLDLAENVIINKPKPVPTGCGLRPGPGLAPPHS